MNVSTEILEKVCRALNCDTSDIMEMTEDIPGNIEYMHEKTK
jgi:DNA-binding Xre family transcriptional regulator